MVTPSATITVVFSNEEVYFSAGSVLNIAVMQGGFLWERSKSVTHWSIPVNNLKESEDFYGGLLGLKAVGRLNNNVMSCFNIDDHNILLCEREKPQDKNTVEERVQHSFTVSPEGFVQACKTLHEKKIPIVRSEA